MKAYAIADAFRAQFAADAAFAAVNCRDEQSGEDLVRPALVFDCTTNALNGTGSALGYTLAVGVEGRADKAAPADADPAIAHAALVALVTAKLLGTGKAALLAALNLPAIFDFRGWNAAASDPAVAGGHFRTPVAITGTALVL